MGILTSMFTAVTGLSSYGNAMGVIGNNIANVGTAGFKSSRATFSDLISSSMAGGSGSDQIGLGGVLGHSPPIGGQMFRQPMDDLIDAVGEILRGVAGRRQHKNPVHGFASITDQIVSGCVAGRSTTPCSGSY